MSAFAEPSSSVRLLGGHFLAHARQLGERPFIRVPNGQTVSWRAALIAVEEIVRGLLASGIQPGDRISLFAPNRVESVLVDLAAMSARFVLVSFGPAYTDAMVEKILNRARPRVVFLENATGVDRIRSLGERVHQPELLVSFDHDVPGAVSIATLRERGRGSNAPSLDEITSSIRPADLATIEFTSGSTGDPKGILLSQRAHLAPLRRHAAAPIKGPTPRPDDTVPLLVPLTHLMGRHTLHGCVYWGVTLSMFELPEADLHLRHIREFAPTRMLIAPRMLTRIWDELVSEIPNLIARLDALEPNAAATNDPATITDRKRVLKGEFLRAFGGRLEHAIYGGAALPPRIQRAFDIVGMPMFIRYGTTECGPICGMDLNPSGSLPSETRVGEVGWPNDDVEVTVAADGEILVKGPGVMDGYLDDPGATAEAIVEGVYRTGDYGAFDPSGCLRVLGRKRDIFRSPEGPKFFPATIELILENDPMIREAIMLGDTQRFNSALVVPNSDVVATSLGKKPGDPPPTAEEVHQAVWSRVEVLNAQFESFQRIRHIRILDAPLPPTVRRKAESGKMITDRKAVAEVYRREIAELYPAG
jgi:long-chain acyl-CoA synthetase